MPLHAFMLYQPSSSQSLRNPFNGGVIQDISRQRRHTSTEIRQQEQPQYSVELQMQLDDEKITALFAWIHQAFQGDLRYNNLLLAMATIFGTHNFPEASEPMRLYRYALQHAPAEETRVGEPYTRQQRERASLGAMGAAQWTGQWRTRPHALLSVQNYTCVQDWIQTLPRGCQRTLNKKALPLEGTNFTVTAIPIPHRASAPHATLAHFRCVVEHEVRLLANFPSYSDNDDDDNVVDVASFFDALSEAVGRYLGTTRMAGEIREYRDANTGRVIAFAHEVIKGRTIRGQWFYATDQAAQSYVWFHSVRSLVERAIQNPNIDVVDLGPSGSDNFSALKARYGFQSVEDWPRYADYQGPFWDYETQAYAKGGIQY
jgi:hypothetical protein